MHPSDIGSPSEFKEHSTQNICLQYQIRSVATGVFCTYAANNLSFPVLKDVKPEHTNSKYCQYTGLPHEFTNWYVKIPVFLTGKKPLKPVLCQTYANTLHIFFSYFLVLLLYMCILHNVHNHSMSAHWVLICVYYLPNVWIHLLLR